MKVNIGNYVRPWDTKNVFNWYLEKMHGKTYWMIDDDQYTKTDKKVEWILDQWQSFLNVTINKFYFDKKERKIEVRIDDHDLWSMDQTLSYVILPMLIRLKEIKHGMPMTDAEDAPDIGKGNETDFGHSDDKMEERWDWILGEMIYAFGTFNDEFESQFHTGHIDLAFVKDETTGLSRMTTGPNDTHKFDRDGYNAAIVRRKNGLRLFAKYYESLWD